MIKNNWGSPQVWRRSCGVQKFIYLAFLFVFGCYDQKNSINSNQNFGQSSDTKYENQTVDPPRTGGISFLYDTTANTEFVENTNDIPLAFGLTRVPDDNLEYDSVNGDIITVTYANATTRNNIKQFYISTMPQMGWKSVPRSGRNNNIDKLKYVRDKQRLSIEFYDTNGSAFVKFFLKSSS